MLTEEVVSQLARRLGISAVEAREQLGIVTERLGEQLENGEVFSIPGLGVFETKVRPEIRSFLPFLQTFALLPPKIRIGFRPCKRLRDLAKQFRW